MDIFQAETDYTAKVLDALSSAPSTPPDTQIDEDKTRNAAACMTAFLCARLATKGAQPEAIERTTFQWSEGIVNIRNAVNNHLLLVVRQHRGY